ncbi:MAG TPA: antitoxin Xre/MbcA/ParS toxin-binding domain-containing protein, partial [Thermodesulfobacteriota bacterium]|nr:antitoxin Xre/MbcA/ParS toxin-binding domain-containing protein [Thermodesulfobacteriota bacterium]
SIDISIYDKCRISERMKMEFSSFKEVLGLKGKIRTPLDLVELGGKGVSKGAVSRLAKHLSIGLQEMAPLLSVNLRTIQRYTPEKVFSRPVSERVLRIALVVSKGEEIFGSGEPFKIWLKEPNRALAEQKPLDLLVSDFGIDLVLEELGRIEHGIIS